ncbi:MAG TPA: HPF/RaiA family ribosome-associated protein [Candidatus Cybelea sp.]|jgi:ribosome-associated translation inhibitor RaiA|nr:HPF/RaiA family ribosome-associated protein [Candidatus Cybelea sp.]
MELPLQITYRGVNPSGALRRLIHKEGAKLDHFFARITSCRVLVEREPRHMREAAPFRVRIDLGVPGNELMTDTLERDSRVAVRDAFRRARRRLQDYATRLKGA